MLIFGLKKQEIQKNTGVDKVFDPYPYYKIKKSTFSGVSEDFREMLIFGLKKQEIQEKTGKSHL